MTTTFINIQKYYDDLSSTEQLAVDYILKYEDLPNIKLEIYRKGLSNNFIILKNPVEFSIRDFIYN